ncbi:hypothetical protein [Nocardiopsis sp. B62]|uniref:hypothetical protein n=1 Tax=Nocardiopsis sp. B62 TaxID=2824874 RepID=UPI001B387F3B|nr:hypothetical protein [Nocardiopsis sp. B62]MBQ1081566.1 hypothetical protein [Nocardiopsis sp. B62]
MTPAADLVDFLRTAHAVHAQDGPEPGRVVARQGGRAVSVVLVGRQWFRSVPRGRGTDLLPLHWRGMEWSVVRVVAKELGAPSADNDEQEDQE